MCLSPTSRNLRNGVCGFKFTATEVMSSICGRGPLRPPPWPLAEGGVAKPLARDATDAEALGMVLVVMLSVVFKAAVYANGMSQAWGEVMEKPGDESLIRSQQRKLRIALVVRGRIGMERHSLRWTKRIAIVRD